MAGFLFMQRLQAGAPDRIVLRSRSGRLRRLCGSDSDSSGSKVEYTNLPTPKWRLQAGAPDRIRTCGPQIRNLMLYPAELRVRRYWP